MFSDPLILHRIIPSGTHTNEHNTWARISQVGQRTEYRKTEPDSASAVKRMIVDHTVVGKGTQKRDRHLLRLEADVVDADDVPTGRIASCHIVCDLPVGTATLQGTSFWTQMVGLLLGESNESAYAGDIDAFWSAWLAGVS